MMQVIFKEELANELHNRYDDFINDHLETLRNMLNNDYYDIDLDEVQREINEIKELEIRKSSINIIWTECNCYKN